MKVSELEGKFNKSVINKYGDLDTLEFLALVDEADKRGDSLPRPIVRIADAIRARERDEALNEPLLGLDVPAGELPQMPLPETYANLRGIPLTVLAPVFPTYKAALASAAFYARDIMQLMHATVPVMNTWRSFGNARVKRLCEVQRWISANHETLYKWHCITSTPQEINFIIGSKKPVEVVAEIIRRIIDIMNRRVSPENFLCDVTPVQRKLLTIIDRRFFQNIDRDTVAHELSRTSELIRSNESAFIDTLMSGKPVFGNITVSADLLDFIKSSRDRILYTVGDSFRATFGDPRQVDLDILGVDILRMPESCDIDIIVPRDTVGRYRRMAMFIRQILREIVIPMPFDDIVARVIMNPDVKSLGPVSLAFIRNYVEAITEPVVLTNYSGVRIQRRFLVSNSQVAAHIIVDSDESLSREEVNRRLVEAGYKPLTSLVALRQFGVSSTGNLWHYGKAKMTIAAFIKDYAIAHNDFYMSDLKDALAKAGYTIIVSVRPHATSVCAVDYDNPDHLCYREYVDRCPQYRWRPPHRMGFVNRVIKMTAAAIAEAGTIPVDQVVARICDSLGDSLARNDKYRILASIRENCGEGLPFLIDAAGNLSANHDVFDNFDFECAGLRGSKFARFPRIREIVLDLFNASGKDSILLTDVLPAVGREYDVEDLRLIRTPVMHAIKAGAASGYPLEFVNVDGRICIRPVSPSSES